MANLYDLLIVQLGQEATDAWGTAVAPTVRLMGIDECSIQPVYAAQQVGDKRGSLAPAYDAVETIVEASGSIGGLVVYDDMPYWLGAAFGRCTSDDAGYTADTEATRVYDAPLDTFDTDLGDPYSFTLVYGDGATSTNAYGLNGATVQSFSISGASGEPLRFSVGLIGKEVVDDELDLTKVDRVVNYAMGDHVTLYIDPASDAFAQTGVSDAAFQFNLEVNCGRSLVRHLGAKTPTKYKDGKWSGTLSLTLELDATTRAYLDDILDGGTALKKAIRIDAESNDEELQIDFIGILLDAPSIYTDMDGLETVELAFQGHYSSDNATWLTITSASSVTALA